MPHNVGGKIFGKIRINSNLRAYQICKSKNALCTLLVLKTEERNMFLFPFTRTTKC